MSLCVLCACVNEYRCLQCPEEEIRFPGVTGSCDSVNMGVGKSTWLLWMRSICFPTSAISTAHKIAIFVKKINKMLIIETGIYM